MNPRLNRISNAIPWRTVGAGLVASILTGCSLSNVSFTACTSSAECKIFGTSFECGSEGFCEDVVPEPTVVPSFPVWKFASIPDFFGLDLADTTALTGQTGTNEANEALIQEIFSALTEEQLDFVLVAGDVAGGQWHVNDNNPFVEGRSEVEALREAADVYYSAWQARWADVVPEVYVAIGDKALGHHPWPAGDPRVDLIFERKRSWLTYFLPDTNAERTVYTPDIGVNNTTYLVHHKNVAIVSMDVFDASAQDETRPVRVRMEDGLDGWVTRTVDELRDEVGLAHVIVQGHAPLFDTAPYRSTCDGDLTIEDGAATQLVRNLLVGIDADVYLTGSTHHVDADVVDGDFVQLAHGAALGCSHMVNYVVGSVYDDRIELEVKTLQVAGEFVPQQTADVARLWQLEDPELSEAFLDARPPRTVIEFDRLRGIQNGGAMTIDKRDGNWAVTDRTGLMQTYSSSTRSEGLLIHLPMDESSGVALANLGAGGEALVGIWESTQPDLTNVNSDIVGAPGRLGGAVEMDDTKLITVSPPGILGNRARTTALWIRTEPVPGEFEDDNVGLGQTVLSYGQDDGEDLVGGKWEFDIMTRSPEALLEVEGVLEVGISGSRILGGGYDRNARLDDNAWHHIVAVVEDGATSLGEDDVRLFIDGEEASRLSVRGDAELDTLPGPMILGRSVDSEVSKPYTGLIDDVAVWGRALQPYEVVALTSFANSTLQYNASEVDALVQAYLEQSAVEIGGRTWVFRASGLSDLFVRGLVSEDPQDTYRVRFGASDGGMVSQPPT